MSLTRLYQNSILKSQIRVYDIKSGNFKKFYLSLHKIVKMNFSGPLPHYVLASQIGDVKHPEQKIKYLKSKGEISSLIRGLYLQKNSKYSKFQIANVLYGPSYVTGITVLSWLGWISERAVTIHSATIKRGKSVDTPVGRFEYFHLNTDVFHFGIQHYNFGPEMSCIMASPTKALYDHILMTPNLQFSGKLDLLTYLEDDLRMDTDLIKELDIKLLEQLMDFGEKKRQITILYNLVKTHI